MVANMSDIIKTHTGYGTFIIRNMGLTFCPRLLLKSLKMVLNASLVAAGTIVKNSLTKCLTKLRDVLGIPSYRFTLVLKIKLIKNQLQ